MFNKTTNNRLIGFGIGLGTTAIVQSSSITTVMVVGLVNAGVLTLLQATAMYYGGECWDNSYCSNSITSSF